MSSLSWKHELENGIETVEDLKEYITISKSDETKYKEIIDRHPLFVTKYYASLLEPDNPEDPLRLMMFPNLAELIESGSYDTSGEHQNTVLPGLQHKYEQTVLLLSTPLCAGYCRYCFRKRLVGLTTDETLQNFGDAVDYIGAHPEINNVLISGGDSFVLDTDIIEILIKKLYSIDHLQFLRFGTKTPVVIPNRIIKDKSLALLLKEYSKPDKRIFAVTHFNHPRELTPIYVNIDVVWFFEKKSCGST
jgi:lysine 2,3-aminomutase